MATVNLGNNMPAPKAVSDPVAKSFLNGIIPKSFELKLSPWTIVGVAAIVFSAIALSKVS